MNDSVANLAVRNLHSAPDDGIADFDTGKFTTVPHRNVRTNLAAVNLDIIAYVARRNDLHPLDCPELGTVIVTAEHMRIRVQERFHQAAV